MSTQTYRLRWAEAALQDFESIIDFLASRAESSRVIQAHDRIMSRAEALTVHPTRGRIVPEIREIGIDDYRELIEDPYRICYRAHGREVVIVAILDARRDLSRILIDRAMGRQFD